MLVFHHLETQIAGDRDVSSNFPCASRERPINRKSFGKDCRCGFPEQLLSIECLANFWGLSTKNTSTALAMGKDLYPFRMHPVT